MTRRSVSGSVYTSLMSRPIPKPRRMAQSTLDLSGHPSAKPSIRQPTPQTDRQKKKREEEEEFFFCLLPVLRPFGVTPWVNSQASPPLRSGPAGDTRGPRRQVFCFYGEQAVNRAFLTDNSIHTGRPVRYQLGRRKTCQSLNRRSNNLCSHSADSLPRQAL